MEDTSPLPGTTTSESPKSEAGHGTGHGPEFKDKPFAPWYGFVLFTVRYTFFAQLGGIEVTGRKNIPKKGPVIIACNHLSELDPPAVACAAKRHMRFMAKQELFKGWFGKLIGSVGAFPVKRGSSDTEAIRRTLDYLETGQCVLLFPEGTRGNGRQLGPLGRGASLLAKRSGAWIVPTAIQGTQFMLPRGAKKVRRGLIRVAFGTPFKYTDLPTREAFLAKLESEMLATAKVVGLELTATLQEEAKIVPEVTADQ